MIRALAILVALTAPAVAAEVDPSAYAPMTRDNFPKTFAAWGKDGISRIEKVRKAAAFKAAENSTCDRVSYAELSDSRSSPPANIVVFADCENGVRFYMTEAEALSDGSATTQQQKLAGVSDSDAIAACEKSVRAELHYPSSMSRHWTGTSVRRAPVTGNVVVDFGFDSLNGLGNEVPSSARCVIDDRGIHRPEIRPM